MSTRLFVCWFIIAFLLANHELFMKPMQPLHFTRGYVWTALFLLGIPGLHYLLDKFRSSSQRLLFSVALSVIFFLDNATWIFNHFRSSASSASTAYTGQEEQQILNVLDEHSDVNTLIVGTESLLPYLATVYTRAYPWVSHPYTTPFVNQKLKQQQDFFKSGLIPASWKGRKLVLIFNATDSSELKTANELAVPVNIIYTSPRYMIIETQLP